MAVITGTGLLIGSNDADTITINGAASSTVSGLGGDDSITRSVANTTSPDSIDGGDGNDTINMSIASSTKGATIVGGAGNDVIAGSVVADNIDGGAGDDLIIGFNGADTVNGGAGIDTIQASDGADITALNTALAADGNIVDVEVVDVSGATAAVNLNFVNQSEAAGSQLFSLLVLSITPSPVAIRTILSSVLVRGRLL